MRDCPVCECGSKIHIWSMGYKIPDGWPLPGVIDWYTCFDCGVLYGDGPFDQATLNEYYQNYYGYGINSKDNVRRLKYAARFHAVRYKLEDGARVLDFGGAGDDGKSIYLTEMQKYFAKIEGHCTNAGDELPKDCDVIFASHVLEHVYDLPETMRKLVDALAPGGIFIIDGPDAANINPEWPILDYNTKHINHFTLSDYARLGHEHGLTAIASITYEIQGYPCYSIHFQKRNIAEEAAKHIRDGIKEKVDHLHRINFPVNVWGLSDVSWHILSKSDVQVLDYIDNDPAYRGKTYNGQPVLEKPMNDAPIVIMSQGQRAQLIAHIQSVCENRIIEI